MPAGSVAPRGEIRSGHEWCLSWLLNSYASSPATDQENEASMSCTLQEPVVLCCVSRNAEICAASAQQVRLDGPGHCCGTPVNQCAGQSCTLRYYSAWRGTRSMQMQSSWDKPAQWWEGVIDIFPRTSSPVRSDQASTSSY